MKRGFTLIELLVALAIIGILSVSVSILAGGAKDKARDSLVKQNLSSIRFSAEEVYFTNYPHTYLPVCFDSIVDLILKDLDRVVLESGQNYQCLSSTEEWLAIFPLRNGGYWCSDGKGRSMGVDGFVEFSSSEYMDCTRAVEEDAEVETPPPPASGGGSTATPVITLNGSSEITIYSQSNNPFRGGAWHKYHEPGYGASDAQDGEISEDIVVIGPNLVSQGGPNSCKQYVYEISYTVVNSGGISSNPVTRTVTHNRCHEP